MSFKEKLKTLLQTKFVKKTGTVFSLVAITSALAFGTIACTPESVQDPPSPPITTPSDDLEEDGGTTTPGDETTDDETTDDETTDPENPDITDPETPTEPEDPDITDPETPVEPNPENPVDPDPEEPEIEDPTPEVSFDSLYNKIFGEDYEFVPFEDYMQSLAERVFSTSTDVKFLIAEADPDAFVIYADAVVGENRRCLLQGTLKTDTYAATYAPILYNLYDLTRQSEAAGGFKQYMQQVYENCADASSARAELETISADLDQSIRVSSGLVRGNFDTTRPVTNTRDDIDFSAYAEEYTPEGATPLKCYVGSFKGYVYDDPLNPLFNTGYTIECPVVVIYSQDGSNQLIIESFNLRVPRHRDYTNEQMYAFGLGEINETYVKLNGETTVIDDPILSEELLANIENSL